MSPADVLVLIFLKAPVPGKVKTRLAATIGAEVAATMYAAWVREILGTLAPLRMFSRDRAPGWRPSPSRGEGSDGTTTKPPFPLARTNRFDKGWRLIAYSGSPTDELPADWRSSVDDAWEQPEADLGTRIRAGFERGFSVGAGRVLAIGTDCLDMTPELLRSAAEALDETPAVIGPATDGGYWLIGLSRGAAPALASIFSAIRWSSPETLADQRERLLAAGLEPATLPTLADLDTEEDLLQHVARRGRRP
jgi:hypothetical protein